MRTGITVEVNAVDHARLEAIAADRNSPQKHVWRARIVLLTSEGVSGAFIKELMRQAWLRGAADGTIEVELIASEDGVSPGQACAFYDAAEGQARVLGGGIIASTVAAPTAKRMLPANLATAQ